PPACPPRPRRRGRAAPEGHRAARSRVGRHAACVSRSPPPPPRPPPGRLPQCRRPIIGRGDSSDGSVCPNHGRERRKATLHTRFAARFHRELTFRSPRTLL